MLKKISIIALFIGVFILGSCVTVDPQGRGYSIAVPIGVINSTLAEKFPVDRELKYGIVSGNLNISNPNVLGQKGKDKLGVGTEFKFTNFLIPNGISGKINLSSGIKYDAESRNLYLKNPMVDTIKFQNESLLEKLPNGVQNAIGMIVAETIAQKPIYNIKRGTLASGLIKGIDVRNGQVFLTFGL